MAVKRVVAMSSWVAAGHVGLSAAAPILQRLGCEVIQLPTTVLSNHKAWPAVAGGPTPPGALREMIEAIGANGWLDDVDAFLTGYLPSAAHAGLAAETAVRLRLANPDLRVIVDPVLGDDPKGLYLPREAAEALRDALAPEADLLTPNRFELSFLAGAEAATLAQAAEAAASLAARRPGRAVVVTSPPLGPETTGALSVGAGGTALYRVARRDGAPNGPGDVLSALLAGGVGLGRALGCLDAILTASLGRPHLAIASADWFTAAAIAPTPLETGRA